MEKKERMYYYPFEYKVLPSHLQEMASKGWMLCNIVDRGFYMVFIYQECEPRTCYFYTDVSDDNNQFLYDIISDEMEDYIQFVEDYGYCFIAGKKGLMVYASDKEISIPIREENHQSKEVVQRATLKSMIFPFIMLFFSILDIYSFFSLFIRDPLYTLENNSTFFSSTQRLLMFALCLFMSLPAIRWCLFHKTKSSFRRFRIRFYLIIIAWLCLCGGIFVRFNKTGFAMLGIVFIPTCLFAWLYNYILRFRKAVVVTYCILAFISMVGIISQSPKIVDAIAPMKYDHDFNHASSIFLTREEKDDISDEGEQLSITKYHVKDTFLKSFIQSQIEKKQREYNGTIDYEGVRKIIEFD